MCNGYITLKQVELCDVYKHVQTTQHGNGFRSYNLLAPFPALAFDLVF